MQKQDFTNIDEIDRQLIFATQKGLPLVSRPYEVLAKDIGISESDVRVRFENMFADESLRIASRYLARTRQAPN